MRASLRVSSFLRSLRLISSIPGITALVLALGVSAAAAQSAADGPTIYRLDKTSTFKKGCFAPCLCPVMLQGTERGTFALTFAGSDPLFDNYRVEEVSWTVSVPGQPDLRVTGSGTYRVGGEFAIQQQLILDLSVGGAAPEHFDSGLVAGGGDFPHLGATISIHGQVCADTVFGVSASPVREAELKAYRLSPGSRFVRGCEAPCDCPLLDPVPVQGSFVLVLLDRGPLGAEFSVAQVRWVVSPEPGDGDPAGLMVTGSGTYRLGGEVAIAQQMALDLKLGTDAPALYDSGPVPGGGDFPRIDIDIQHTTQTCLITRFELRARPAKLRATASGIDSETGR